MFAYNITYYFSYFLIMIVFMIIAIVAGKKGYSWVFYGIGAVVQFLSLFGNAQRYNAMGMGQAMTPYWTVYFVLLAVSAALIVLRRLLSKK